MDPSNSLVIETHNLSKTYKEVQALSMAPDRQKDAGSYASETLPS